MQPAFGRLPKHGMMCICQACIRCKNGVSVQLGDLKIVREWYNESKTNRGALLCEFGCRSSGCMTRPDDISDGTMEMFQLLTDNPEDLPYFLQPLQELVKVLEMGKNSISTHPTIKRKRDKLWNSPGFRRRFHRKVFSFQVNSWTFHTVVCLLLPTSLARAMPQRRIGSSWQETDGLQTNFLFKLPSLGCDCGHDPRSCTQRSSAAM